MLDKPSSATSARSSFFIPEVAQVDTLSLQQAKSPKLSLTSSYYWMLLLCVALCGVGLNIGCVERDSTLSFVVTSVSPESPSPGDEITVRGRGFGSSLSRAVISSELAPRQVSVGGRALVISQWSPSKIRATLPADVPTGERTLVVSRDHIHSPSYPIYIPGEGGARPRPQMDLSPLGRDQAGIDMSIDMTVDIDQALPPPLNVTLDDEGAAVVIRVEQREESDAVELWLTLLARDLGEQVWGAASHLAYPVERLEFLQMTASPGTTAAAHTGDLPGRIFWYHGALENTGDAEVPLITLRFRLIDPADRSAIRFDIPARSATLRGVNNQRLSGRWSGGLVNLQEVTP